MCSCRNGKKMVPLWGLLGITLRCRCKACVHCNACYFTNDEAGNEFICRCVTVVTSFSTTCFGLWQYLMSKWHNLQCSLSVSAVTEQISIQKKSWQRSLYHKCVMRQGEKRWEWGDGGDICGAVLISCSHQTQIDLSFLRLLYASC